MGMNEASKKWIYKSSTLLADLQRKLDPRRFHWVTPTMSGVVGYVLGVPFAIPVIEELVVVYDGAIIARPRGSTKTSIIGSTTIWFVVGNRCCRQRDSRQRNRWLLKPLFATVVVYMSQQTA